MSSPRRFLARWARLKRADLEGGTPLQPENLPIPAVAALRVEVSERAIQPARPDVVEKHTSEERAPKTQEGAVLPDVESLTFESDFTTYLQHEVTEAVRRQALKKLFGDPRFNEMDGLDIYIDDYSIPSPVPADMLMQIRHAQLLLNDETTPSGESAAAPTEDTRAVAEVVTEIEANMSPSERSDSETTGEGCSDETLPRSDKAI